MRSDAEDPERGEWREPAAQRFPDGAQRGDGEALPVGAVLPGTISRMERVLVNDVRDAPTDAQRQAAEEALASFRRAREQRGAAA